MAETTKIEWADATFNPWRGCSKVSPACTNCYADSLSKRNPKVLGQFGPNGTRICASAEMWKQPLKWDEAAEANQQYHSANLPYDPPRPRVFCASLADVFEDWDGLILNSKGETLWKDHVSGEVAVFGEFKTRVQKPRYLTMADLRQDLFTLIDRTQNLDWLLLTKRPQNVMRMWPSSDRHTCLPEAGALNEYPMHHRPNVWIGTTVENQEYADKRIPELLKCRDLAPVLFLSCEPLLGPVNLSVPWEGEETAATLQVDWVIAGGESGRNARPSHPDWFRSLRDQCSDADVPFHFKQWGEWLPISEASIAVMQNAPAYAEVGILSSGKFGSQVTREVCDAEGDLPMLMYRVGVKTAGRILDGVTHDGFPTAGVAS